MGSEQSRKLKIAKLYELISTNSKETDVKKLYGFFALNFGTSLKTFCDYLKVLEINGKLAKLPSVDELKRQITS